MLRRISWDLCLCVCECEEVYLCVSVTVFVSTGRTKNGGLLTCSHKVDRRGRGLFSRGHSHG